MRRAVGRAGIALALVAIGIELGLEISAVRAREEPAPTHFDNGWPRHPPRRFLWPSDPVPGAIRGLVVDDLGWAVGGARVESSGGRAAVTDSGGRFELRDVRSPAPRDLVVCAHGFLPAVREAVRAGESVRIRLARLGSIEGFVVDPDGAPIPGARVRLLHSRWPECDRESTSDRDGRYRLAATPLPSIRDSARGGLSWRVEADGFAPFAGDASSISGSGTGRFRCSFLLDRASLVEGRLVDADGEPVSGARVLAARAHAGASAIVEAVSDGDGRFRIGPIPVTSQHALQRRPGRWSERGTLLAIAPGLAPAFVADLEVPPPGESSTHELLCPRAVTVRGRVVDSRGSPIAGVRVHDQALREAVRLLGETAAAAARICAVTDERGRFEIDSVPIASRRLIVEGFAGFAGEPAPRGAVVVEAGVGSVEATDLAIDLSRTVPVSVSDRGGAAIRGATLELEKPYRRSWTTGAGGTCTLVPPERGASDPEESWPLVVAAPGCATAVLEDLRSCSASGGRIAIELDPESRICGRIRIETSTSSEAVFRGEIFAMPPGIDLAARLAAERRRRDFGSGGSEPGAGHVGRCEVGRDGWFELRGLPAGSYALLWSGAIGAAGVHDPVATGTLDLDWVVPDPRAD